MKKYIIPVLFGLILCTGIWSFHYYIYTPDSVAHSLIKDISNGTFRIEYEFTGNSKLTDHFIYATIHNINFEFNYYRDFDTFRDRIFKIPKNIIAYKLIKKDHSKIDFWVIEDYSEKFYNNNRTGFCNTYNEYFKLYAEYDIEHNKYKNAYSWNPETKILKYIEAKVGRYQYYYKLRTARGFEYFTMIFIRVPNKGWKMAGSELSNTSFNQ